MDTFDYVPISRKDFEAKAFNHPLVQATGDEALAMLTRDALIEIYDKLVKAKNNRPLTKNEQRTVLHTRTRVIIGGGTYEYSVESSRTLTQDPRHLINIKLGRLGSGKFDMPAIELLNPITLRQAASESTGSLIEYSEGYHLQIDPVRQYPESLVQAVLGQRLSRLIDDPMALQPSISRLELQSIKVSGPFGSKNDIFTLSGRMAEKP